MKKIDEINNLISDGINVISSQGVELLFCRKNSLGRNTLNFVADSLCFLLKEREKEENLLKNKNIE